MSRFFYTLRDGELLVDPDGVEYANAEAAKREAVSFLGEWLRDNSEAFARDDRCELTVTNECGETMWVLTADMAYGPGDRARRAAND